MQHGPPLDSNMTVKLIELQLLEYESILREVCKELDKVKAPRRRLRQTPNVRETAFVVARGPQRRVRHQR